MGIKDKFRVGWNVVKRLFNIGLNEKIAELEEKNLELTHHKRDREEQIERLKEQLETQKSMVFRKPFWYMNGDPQPYCPICWEVSGLPVHLDGPNYFDRSPRKGLSVIEAVNLAKLGGRNYFDMPPKEHIAGSIYYCLKCKNSFTIHDK